MSDFDLIQSDELVDGDEIRRVNREQWESDAAADEEVAA
jgi:hypothetical protein